MCKETVEGFLVGFIDNTVWVSLHSSQWNTSSKSISNNGNAWEYILQIWYFCDNSFFMFGRSRQQWNVFQERNIISKHTVYQSIKKFKVGRSKHGRWTVRQYSVHALQEDCRYTDSDIQHNMAILFLNEASHITIYCVITETLKISKMRAWWVPHKLLENHRTSAWGVH